MSTFMPINFFLMFKTLAKMKTRNMEQEAKYLLAVPQRIIKKII